MSIEGKRASALEMDHRGRLWRVIHDSASEYAIMRTRPGCYLIKDSVRLGTIVRWCDPKWGKGLRWHRPKYRNGPHQHGLDVYRSLRYCLYDFIGHMEEVEAAKETGGAK